MVDTSLPPTNNLGVIYCLTSPSGKVYIGQSWNVKQRFSHYRNLHSSLKRQPLLYNALKKYGPENFQYTILRENISTQEELDNTEIFFIKTKKSLNDNFGYNLRDGGSRGKLSETSKRKISVANKGKNHPNWGKPRSKEFKNKLSKAISGKKHYFYGKQHSYEYKQKMSKKLRGKNNGFYGKHHSENTKIIMSNIKKGKKLTDSHRASIKKATTGENNPMYGKKHTKETRQKLKNSYKFNLKYVYCLFKDEKKILVINLSKFCKNNNLSSAGLANVMAGRQNTHRGWSIKKRLLTENEKSLLCQQKTKDYNSIASICVTQPFAE